MRSEKKIDFVLLAGSATKTGYVRNGFGGAGVDNFHVPETRRPERNAGLSQHQRTGRDWD